MGEPANPIARVRRPDELALSYNGGKDCLVLLILILASLPPHFPPPTSSAPPPLSSCGPTAARFPVLLQAIYIRPHSPFPEIDDFVASSTKEYHLELATSNKPMKQALADYLKEMFAVRAVFVGTRRTDPHGAHLQHFQETDGDWPRFMRIHPVIDWHYREVWAVSSCPSPVPSTTFRAPRPVATSPPSECDATRVCP